MQAGEGDGVAELVFAPAGERPGVLVEGIDELRLHALECEEGLDVS